MYRVAPTMALQAAGLLSNISPILRKENATFLPRVFESLLNVRWTPLYKSKEFGHTGSPAACAMPACRCAYICLHAFTLWVAWRTSLIPVMSLRLPCISGRLQLHQ